MYLSIKSHIKPQQHVCTWCVYNVQHSNFNPSKLTKHYVKDILTFAEISDENHWKTPF